MSGSRAVAPRMRNLTPEIPLVTSDDVDRDSYKVVSQCVCRYLISWGSSNSQILFKSYSQLYHGELWEVSEI